MNVLNSESNEKRIKARDIVVRLTTMSQSENEIFEWNILPLMVAVKYSKGEFGKNIKRFLLSEVMVVEDSVKNTYRINETLM